MIQIDPLLNATLCFVLYGDQWTCLVINKVKVVFTVKGFIFFIQQFHLCLKVVSFAFYQAVWKQVMYGTHDKAGVASVKNRNVTVCVSFGVEHDFASQMRCPSFGVTFL